MRISVCVYIYIYIAGGANGKLKTKGNYMKFARTLSNNELFAKQSTP